MPLPPSGRGDASSVQLLGNLPQTGCPGVLNLLDHSSQFRGSFIGSSLDGLHSQFVPVLTEMGGSIRTPSFTPRSLAAARAALVLAEMALRSSWATKAMMPTVNSLAVGMSTATNFTPAS
jgi:hypothetical protein